MQELKRDRVCNPVTHVLEAIEVFKRFGRGLQPPTSIGIDIYTSTTDPSPKGEGWDEGNINT